MFNVSMFNGCSKAAENKGFLAYCHLTKNQVACLFRHCFFLKKGGGTPLKISAHRIYGGCTAGFRRFQNSFHFLRAEFYP